MDMITLQRLEQDAYYAVMLVMASTPLDWTKEKLLTDLREQLHISGDQHKSVLEEVHSDTRVQTLRRLTAEEQGLGGRARHARASSPTLAAPQVSSHAQHYGAGRGPGRGGTRVSMDGTQVKRGPGRPPIIKTSDSFREPEQKRGPGRPPNSGRVSTAGQPVSPTSARLGRQKRSTTFFDEAAPTPASPFAPPLKSARTQERMLEDPEVAILTGASRGGYTGGRGGRGRGKHIRHRSSNMASAVSSLAAQTSNLSAQLATQPSRGPGRMQRVPFLPDLLDPVLSRGSVEELHVLLNQLDTRRTDILQELEVARCLMDDNLDAEESCLLQLRDLAAQEASTLAELADNRLVEDMYSGAILS